MSDIKLDPLTGDLDISSGLTIITGDTEKVQRLRLAIGINLGEWFLDVLTGVPYLNTQDPSIPESTRYFLGDTNPGQESYIKKTLDAYILDLSYITSVESTTSIDNSTREFTYEYVATTPEGDIIEDVFSNSF